MKISFKKFQNILPAIIAFFIVVLLFSTEKFFEKNINLNDFYYNSTPRTGNDIVIVAIDDKSLKSSEMGRWQDWSRKYYTDIIEKLIKAEAKVIGIDVLFSEISKDTNADNSLKLSASKNTNVILASKIELDRPEEIYSKNNWAYVDIPVNEDGIARSLDISKYQESDIFSIKVFKSFINFEEKIQISNNKLILNKSPTRLSWDIKRKISPTFIPIIDKNRILINFYGPPRTFKRFSFTDVYNNRIDQKEFKNKIVLIGEDGAGLFDEQYTPIAHGIKMPGVEIHANMIETLLKNDFLLYQSKTGFYILLLLLFIFSTYIFAFNRLFIGVIGLIFSLLFIIIYSTISFNISGVLIHTLYFIIGVFLNYILILLYRYFTEEKDKKYIQKAFSQYVNQELMNQLIEGGKKLQLGGEKKELSIFFSDIAGFTSISEKLDAEGLIKLLNEYLTEMTDIIMNNKGTVDKYEGDAVMAFWGAPVDVEDHAKMACYSALENQLKIKELQSKWKEKNLPELSIRIGIHTGEVIVGNIGSKKRFNYTVIGDSVNLASRLEGVNKQYGTSIIISEATYNQAKDFIYVRELDSVRVKGKNIPIKIYELISKSGDIDENKKQIVTKYEEALHLYRNKKFTEAIEIFEDLSNKNDESSKILLSRCKEYKKNPPPESWDGVYQMTSK